MLYQHAYNHLKKLHIKLLVVWTLAENRAAIKFYQDRGCRMTTWSKNFRANGQVYSEIALVCDLE